MDYYDCPLEQVRLEIQRRGYISSGGRDQLSEWLKKDDAARGPEASTIQTARVGPFLPPQQSLVLRRNEFGHTVAASEIVGERIIYWTLNTFFPTLQLFFASGRSCTIDGSHLPSATVGLDAKLRFRLTDCTHEEDGRRVKTTVPDKFASAIDGIAIQEATVAMRTSVAVRSIPCTSETAIFSSPMSSARTSTATIACEKHSVIGLRLEGMNKMAYIWARVDTPSSNSNDDQMIWGDVRIAGLRRDVPPPLFLGDHPEQTMKPGAEATIVIKESMISGNTLQDDIEEFWRY